MARIAKSLATLRDQVNAKWPTRSKVSDGWIGDSKHAARKSDHNPNPSGVVCALDITHDPARGLDAGRLADTIRLSGDPRVNCVISNGRIANSGQPWRKYTGSNAHTQHCHISVKQTASLYDDAKPWKIDGAVTAPQTGTPVVIPQTTPPLLKKGSKGQYVRNLQAELNKHGAALKVDGDYGQRTEAAVKSFQRGRGLKVDGKVGPQTWGALLAKTPELDPEEATTVPSWPAEAKKFFLSPVGLPEVSAAAFTASFIWESGGNQKQPWTIKWDAVGDNGNSIGGGQWNKAAGRQQGLHDLAAKRGTAWTDPWTQLHFAWQELQTTEKRAFTALMAARTVEEANKAAISYWRPGTPHADRRLAIAKALLA